MATNRIGPGAPDAGPWAPRAIVGGALMGLANLVPGISGGTMLLAVGIYPRFIEAVADATRLRFRLKPLLLLGTVAAAAGMAILLLAGTLRDLVVHQRWIMYSLFIGLTLGGVPLVWRLAQPAGRAVWLGAGGGFLAMVALVLLQSEPTTTGTASSGPLLLAVAGAAGAAAMILPGLSGGYLLLVLGQYVPVLGAIDRLLDGIRNLDASALIEASGVLVPVLVGMAIGATAISNAVRFALAHYRQATLGVLLGLLLGAAVGLWPFGAAFAAPTEDLRSRHETLQIPRPEPRQALLATGLVAIGFLLTCGAGRLGLRDSDRS